MRYEINSNKIGFYYTESFDWDRLLRSLQLLLSSKLFTMRIAILLTMLSFFFSPKPLDAQVKSIYDIKIEGLEGGTIDLKK